MGLHRISEEFPGPLVSMMSRSAIGIAVRRGALSRNQSGIRLQLLLVIESVDIDDDRGDVCGDLQSETGDGHKEIEIGVVLEQRRDVPLPILDARLGRSDDGDLVAQVRIPRLSQLRKRSLAGDVLVLPSQIGSHDLQTEAETLLALGQIRLINVDRPDEHLLGHDLRRGHHHGSEFVLAIEPAAHVCRKLHGVIVIVLGHGFRYPEKIRGLGDQYLATHPDEQPVHLVGDGGVLNQDVDPIALVLEDVHHPLEILLRCRNASEILVEPVQELSLRFFRLADRDRISGAFLVRKVQTQCNSHVFFLQLPKTRGRGSKTV